MLAVERQRRITSQLESLQAQQRARVARFERVGTTIIVVILALTGGITLGLLFLFLFQPDLFLTLLSFLSGAIDTVMQLVRYLSTGLSFIDHQSWLLTGAALVIVIMTGIWLRLMRPPREA
jgi:predicted membrane-bound spermidine synthase